MKKKGCGSAWYIEAVSRAAGQGSRAAVPRHDSALVTGQTPSGGLELIANCNVSEFFSKVSLRPAHVVVGAFWRRTWGEDQATFFSTTRAGQRCFRRGRGRGRRARPTTRRRWVKRMRVGVIRSDVGLSALSPGAVVQRDRPWGTCGDDGGGTTLAPSECSENSQSRAKRVLLGRRSAALLGTADESDGRGCSPRRTVVEGRGYEQRNRESGYSMAMAMAKAMAWDGMGC